MTALTAIALAPATTPAMIIGTMTMKAAAENADVHTNGIEIEMIATTTKIGMTTVAGRGTTTMTETTIIRMRDTVNDGGNMMILPAMDLLMRGASLRGIMSLKAMQGMHWQVKEALMADILGRNHPN